MRKSVAFAFLLSLAGCGQEWSTSYPPLPTEATRGWHAAEIAVFVPYKLTTTDENSMAPNVDIVWHGDPAGDRHLQVQAIVDHAARSAALGLSGPRPIRIEAEVTAFHAITPRAVAHAPAGVHNIRLVARVVDADTGEELVAPVEIHADLPALVGIRATSFEQAGNTEKDRITRHLAEVFAGWLGTGPDNQNHFVSLGR